MSSRQVGGSVPPCPLYMECDEEPLSMVQLYSSRKKLSNLNKQLFHLEKLAQSSNSVKYTSEGVVLRVPEVLKPGDAKAGEGNSNVVAPGRSSVNSHAKDPPGPSAVPSPPQPASATAPPGYRLIMDPRTGRILGTIDSSGGRSMHDSMPVAPPVPRASPSLPPLRPKVPSPRTPAVVDLTRHAEKPKSLIPTLLVVPKCSKGLPTFQAQVKRSELDAQVKSLLIHTPAKFTEWLIQQGLIPSEQWDIDPITGSRSKLKLGMYSDGKKFPSSGGYVWINEKRANKCISVYSGSIFMATNHAPTVILKLIYHWSCQTNVSNVVQWVKVDQGVVNLYYKLFRSVCTVSVHSNVLGLGGSNKTVEVGVISLGTTSAESARREVKVEVLGVLDAERGIIRLRASEPAVGVTQAERFARIFEPLPHWVHKSSWIITDLSVDEEQLSRLGYKNVRQCSVNAKRTESNNAAVMDFLKRTVPKMFQNNLSYLSISDIQQFLDELTFREINHFPQTAFESLIAQIARITGGVRSHSDLVGYLQKVQENPFNNWSPISSSTSVMSEPPKAQLPTKKRPLPAAAVPDEIDVLISKKIKVSSELVDLESYFYGTLPGDMKILMDEFKADMAFKCHLCREVYMNNLDFMKHLFQHAERPREPPVDLSDLLHCKYCLKDFENSGSLESHINSAHSTKCFKFICRICKENFRLKNHLIHHMTKAHVHSELPYLCHLCGFRSSSHVEVVDHFYEAHDRTDKLQCPHCLNICPLMNERGYNADVASAFISHIQFHTERKGFSCKSCSLSFLQNDSLRNHVIRDHASFKDFETLVPYAYGPGEEPIAMPRPDERLARPAAKKLGAPKPLTQTAFAAQNLEDMVMYNVEKEDCGECGKRITYAGHFAAYLCCTKCRYSTCCSKAISVHYNLFHGSSKPVYTLGEPCILAHEIYCVCGFSTISGNKMAKHLGSNGCKSAYPNKETAIKAIKTSILQSTPREEKFNTHPPLVRSSGEGGLKLKIRVPTERGPLAFLGLQRNPPPSISEDPPPPHEESPPQQQEQVVEAGDDLGPQQPPSEEILQDEVL